jgi:DNA helicase-2/ATP-dependent DNA helicase PcrA
MIQGFTQLVNEKDSYEAARTIAESTGILKELGNDKSPEGISRIDNIQELLNGIREFSLNAREEGRSDKLADFLEEVSLLTDQDMEKDEDRDKVTLMTVHSAKGLEFKNVFVVGLEENLFPSAQAQEKRTPEAIEEERRLFYVALTRAKENAWLSFASQRYRWGKLDFCNPSRFLTEVDNHYLDGYNSITKMKPDEKSYNDNYNKPGTYEKNQTERDYTIPKPFRRDVLINKINTNNKSAQEEEEFIGDDPEKIVQGMTVMHQRFGTGKVLKVEGTPPDKKAFVFFHNAGNKQLLLKFAKLKIIG